MRSFRKVAAQYLPALAIVLAWQCIASPIWIPTASMEPTIRPGDVLWLNRLSYGIHLPLFSKAEVVRWDSPKRGDIIVFNAPAAVSRAEVLYVKRVVAIAGDTVSVADHRITLNGQVLPLTRSDGAESESLGSQTHSVRTGSSALPDIGPLKIQRGEVFVMGDNRANSNDSRAWGTLPLARVRGQVTYRMAGLSPSDLKGFAKL